MNSCPSCGAPLHVLTDGTLLCERDGLVPATRPRGGVTVSWDELMDPRRPARPSPTWQASRWN